MKYEKIKEKIENGDQYFLYNMKVDKPYLLVKGKTKTLLKNELKHKVIKNPDKYRDTNCILMYFEFRKRDSRFTFFGDLLVYAQEYKITNKLSLEGKKKPLGYVNFDEKYLEEEGFSYNYLRNIIYLIKLDKITFFSLGQPDYSGLKGRIRKALLHYGERKH